MARRKRKFDDGGDIDLGDLQTPVAPIVSDDDVSFKKAFAQNRKAGVKDFKWRGKSYTTQLAGAGAKPSVGDLGETVSTAKRIAPPGPLPDPTYAEYAASGRNKLPRYDANIKQRGLNELTPKEKEAMRGVTATGASLIGGGLFGPEILGAEGLGGLGGAEELVGTGRLANLERGINLGNKWRKGRDIAEKLWKARTGAGPDQTTMPIRDLIRERSVSGMGYKKGGKVKKYAAGGSIRGSGCEAKGKTKGIMR